MLWLEYIPFAFWTSVLFDFRRVWAAVWVSWLKFPVFLSHQQKKWSSHVSCNLPEMLRAAQLLFKTSCPPFLLNKMKNLMASQPIPPWRTPQPRNKGWIAGLIKGNQWSVGFFPSYDCLGLRPPLPESSGTFCQSLVLKSLAQVYLGWWAGSLLWD